MVKTSEAAANGGDLEFNVRTAVGILDECVNVAGNLRER
jgi:hypothetical protein